METELEQLQTRSDGLLATATFHAQDINAQCADVVATLFPAAKNSPTEAMMSAVSTKLSAMVAGIYSMLVPEDDCGDSIRKNMWNMLSDSGFLRDRPLIDFLIARHTEEQIRNRLVSKGRYRLAEQLPALLLKHADANVADAAQTILASSSLTLRNPQILFRELNPEILHKLCWQIVAIFEFSKGQRDKSLTKKAKKLLAEHDESQISRIAAQKLIHFLDDYPDQKMLDPEFAGLDLFVAKMSAETGLYHDHVLRMLEAASIAPTAAMLRVCGAEKKRALEIIGLFRDFDFTPQDIDMFNNSYDETDVDIARFAIRGWANERNAFLESPPLAAGETP